MYAPPLGDGHRQRPQSQDPLLYRDPDGTKTGLQTYVPGTWAPSLLVPSYRLTALAFPPCSSLCSQECSVWVSPQKTFCLLDTLASSPGSPGSVYLGRNLGHNLSSPPSYLEGDHRMPGEAFSHPTALENIGYLYPVSWQPPLSRIGRKSAGWGAMGPGVLVPACPRTERYAARVPVCPLM